MADGAPNIADEFATRDNEIADLRTRLFSAEAVLDIERANLVVMLSLTDLASLQTAMRFRLEEIDRVARREYAPKCPHCHCDMQGHRRAPHRRSGEE